MKRWLSILAVAVFVSQAPAPPVPKGGKFSPISLKEKANQAYDKPFHSGVETNVLKDFPQGDQKFGDVPFTIGDNVT